MFDGRVQGLVNWGRQRHQHGMHASEKANWSDRSRRCDRSTFADLRWGGERL